MSLDIDIDIQSQKFQKVLEIFKDVNKKFIVIDGVIGAGKTTLIKLIQEDNHNNHNHPLKIKAIFEPVDLWNKTGALQYFYKDIDKNCYEFQTYTFITRIGKVIDEIYENPDADIYIMERSIWTDRYIFMELLKKTVGEMRMIMYKQWCDMWAYIMPMRVDKWVLLDTSLDESLRRIEMRKRDGEDGISIEYQTNLYNKHIEFYNKLKSDGKPVIIIDSNLMDSNFIEDKSHLDNIIKEILE
jgi:deoxyadenosine/deoxycytidine kinase